MNLFQVLSMNERVVVWSSQEDNTIITWNQDKTLLLWEECRPGEWSEIGIMSLMYPASFAQARRFAKEWMVDGRNEGTDQQGHETNYCVG
jgi:hypothetical protein